MRFDFLTPGTFDLLVIANLIVALVLIAFRFYQDMTHAEQHPAELREQKHDESSLHVSNDDNTQLSASLQQHDDTQQSTQNQ